MLAFSIKSLGIVIGLSLLAATVPAVAVDCVTEDQIITKMTSLGLHEYRRGEHLNDPQHGSVDLAIAFVDEDGDGLGVWFDKGCATDVQEATSQGADQYFEKFKAEERGV